MSDATPLLTPGDIQEGKTESVIPRPKRTAPLRPDIKKKVDEELDKEIKEINKILKSKHSAFTKSNKK